MPKVNVSLAELLGTRDDLVASIKEKLADRDRKFLMSFVSNNLDWSLVRDSKVKDFPSVKWKLLNQGKMKEDKHSEYVKNVKNVFD